MFINVSDISFQYLYTFVPFLAQDFLGSSAQCDILKYISDGLTIFAPKNWPDNLGGWPSSHKRVKALGL